MNEHYLNEAYNQLGEVKDRIEGIYSLLERGLEVKKAWCDHCLVTVKIDDKNRCPRCGVKIK